MAWVCCKSGYRKESKEVTGRKIQKGEKKEDINYAGWLISNWA